MAHPKKKSGPEGLSTKEARLRFSEVLGRAQYAKERIRLTRRGETVAYVVPQEDVDMLEQLELLEDAADIQKALKEIEKGETITLTELKQRLGFA